jgi:hypothetical protein
MKIQTLWPAALTPAVFSPSCKKDKDPAPPAASKKSGLFRTGKSCF